MYVPPYMPTHISFMLNHAPYYKLMQVPDTASITVSAILQHACAVMNKDLEMVPSELRLRWITDQVSVSGPFDESLALSADAHYGSVIGEHGIFYTVAATAVRPWGLGMGRADSAGSLGLV